jgi:hypothetical protein
MAMNCTKWEDGRYWRVNNDFEECDNGLFQGTKPDVYSIQAEETCAKTKHYYIIDIWIRYLPSRGIDSYCYRNILSIFLEGNEKKQGKSISTVNLWALWADIQTREPTPKT